jgi:hypothetical protein
MADGALSAEQAKHKMTELIKLVEANLPERFGIILMVFGLQDLESCNYISNCQRREAITAVEAWLVRQKGKPIAEQPGSGKSDV